MLSNDERSGVFVVRDRQRVICVWGSVYQIDRHLYPDEYECRLQCRIIRGEHGAPVLITKRGSRSSFLLSRTIRKFEQENQVSCKPVELGMLNSMAASECGRAWPALTTKERLRVLEWIAKENT